LAEENNEYVALNNQGDFDGLPEGLRKQRWLRPKRGTNVLGVMAIRVHLWNRS
jgi:peptidyl-dipeptidase Dcp